MDGAYRVQQGDDFDVLHELLKLDGSGGVTGEAANLVGTLHDPDTMASLGTVVSFAEIATSGVYHATGGPLDEDPGDQYLLIIQEPANPTFDPDLSAGRRVLYAIQIMTGAQAAASGITTLLRVRERFTAKGGTILDANWDSLLTSLISEASDVVHRKIDRILPQAIYTEYLDGTDSSRLYLAQGPVVSVTSVEEISWDDDGAGNRVETATTVVPADFLVYEQASRGEHGKGYLELNDRAGIWWKGTQNWKVVYTAGYATIPESLVQAATDYVVQKFVTREMRGLTSKLLGDATVDRIAGANVDDELNVALGPWMGSLPMVF